MPLTGAEKAKRYREKMKNNLQKYEQTKKRAKERALKSYYLKKSTMTEEQKNLQRAKWRAQKDINKPPIQTEQAASSSLIDPPQNEGNATVTRNFERRIERTFRQENAKLRNCLENMMRRFQRLQKQVRMQEQKLSEMSQNYEKIMKNLETQDKDTEIENGPVSLQENYTPYKKTEYFVSQNLPNLETPKKEAVKQKLLEHHVLTEALKTKYKRSANSDKNTFKEVVDNDLVRKYKMKTKLTNTLGLKNNFKKYQDTRSKSNILQNKIIAFYERDDVSRASAGKKECKTMKKCKKQKRYLLDKLRNLHKKYIDEIGPVSFSTFKKYRPFFVVAPGLKDLETCACMKHCNMQFIANTLKSLEVVETNDLKELISLFVCDIKFKSCMYGECNICSEKYIAGNFAKSEDATWFAWTLKEHEYAEKGNLKKTKKMVKVERKSTVKDLIDLFNNEVKTFKKHVFNVYHQYQQYKLCMDNLESNEVAIHIDFSENWVCKHNQEVQAMHFGASKKQITLHTGVLYVKDEDPFSFCSISPDNSHNPEGIWAHLDPILNYVKLHYPDIDSIHFFSDGPTSQYRQKKNFFLFSRNVYDLGFTHATWSFFEAAHGKGTADGIGGAVKRTLDFSVAHGLDIPDAETAFDVLTKTETIVEIFYVEAECIKPLDASIATKLTPLPNTMKLHQVVAIGKFTLKHRELSCFCRNLKGKCECYSPRLHRFEMGEEIENGENYNTLTEYELELDENTGEMRSVRPSKSDCKSADIDEENYDADEYSAYEFDLEETDINVDILNDSALLNEIDETETDENSIENDQKQQLKRKRESYDSNGPRTSHEIIIKKCRQVSTLGRSRFIPESSEEDDLDYSVHDSSNGSNFLDDTLENKENINDRYESTNEDNYDDMEINKDSYVLVKFILEKRSKFYAGQVLGVSDENSHKVKFLRHKGKGKFAWPINDDVSLVYKSDIEKLLGNPLSERRGIKT